MYIKKLEIKNYGCIEKFDFSPNFDENGNPTPIVLIGENASGKTLLLSNIIDALVEIKRKVFTNGISEVEDDNYFKIGNKQYIRNDSDFSCVDITCSFNEKTSNYIDVMSTNPQRLVDNQILKKDKLENVSKFLENGFSRKTTINELKVKDYDSFIQLYFPNDRYYAPMWYNAKNYTKIDYSSDANINKGKSNLIKIDLYENINEWIRDLFLSQSIVPLRVTTPNGQTTIFTPTHTPLHTCINKILSIIKNSENASVVSSRKRKDISFNVNNKNCGTLSQLSQGEMFLFSIFSSIIKEWDLSHNTCDLNEITGCVVIDEADLGLHIDFLNRAFPKLMRLFPKIQFIITTHSPFLLNGLEREYEKNIDIINMPNGQKIDDVSMFSEMVETYKIFDERLLTTQKTIQELSTIISQNQNKIIVFTEGKTDALILNKAIEKLNLTKFENLEIKPVNEAGSDLTSNNTELKTFLIHVACNNISNNLIIGIFDRDAKIEFSVDNKKQDIRDTEYIKLCKKVYAFALPVPHKRPEENEISIEHYFTNDEIKTVHEEKRLFLCNEFRSNGVSKDKKYFCKEAINKEDSIKIIEHSKKVQVTNLEGTKDYSLSKAIFANNINDDIEGFNNFNFKEFNKIFDIIQKIVEEENN